jgi:hypothetical protein
LEEQKEKELKWTPGAMTPALMMPLWDPGKKLGQKDLSRRILTGEEASTPQPVQEIKVVNEIKVTPTEELSTKVSKTMVQEQQRKVLVNPRTGLPY